MAKCNNCPHPNCPKCGTTHGMSDCEEGKDNDKQDVREGRDNK